MGSESYPGKLGPKNIGICAAGGSVRSRVFGAGAHFATTCRIDPRVSAALPTYASFRISDEGSLVALPVPQPAQVPGSSPSQALISPDGRLLFDANFLENPFNNAGFAPLIPPFSTELHSYRVDESGALIPAAQVAPPFLPFILGLQVHPERRILYAGL